MKLKALFKNERKQEKCDVTIENNKLYLIEFKNRYLINDYSPFNRSEFSIEKVMSRSQYFKEYNYYISYINTVGTYNQLLFKLTYLEYQKLKYASGKSFLNDKVMIKDFIFMIIGIILGWLISK